MNRYPRPIITPNFDGGLVGGAGLGVDEADVLGSFGGVSCTQGASSLVVAHSPLRVVSVVGSLFWVGGTEAFVHSLT